MFKWTPYPFVRFTLAFIIGILCAINFSSTFLNPLWLLIFMVVGFLALYLGTGRNFSPWISPLLGVFALFFLVFAGYYRTIKYRADKNPHHIIHQKNNFDYYQAVVLSTTETKGNYIRSRLEIKMINLEDSWISASGNVILIQPLSQNTTELVYGDLLVIKGHPRLIPPSPPWSSFDYRTFMRYQNVFHQHFISPENLKVLDNRPPNMVVQFSLQLRKRFERIFRKYIKGENEERIALAIVLGMREQLTPELKASYAQAGTMHILAVSGLHVGILYLVMLGLLGWLKKGKVGNWIVATISLSVLWMYALITGLSPSVFRAVIMFTVIILAQAFQRQSNIYNTLAISALILLLINPFMITSIGFQLSYIAVIGIVYIYPKLFLWIKVNNYFLEKAWSIVCVTASAQLATFPLTLYYFHQFPTYFMASNLLVVPAAFLMLCLGFGTLLFSFWPLATAFFSGTLEVLIRGVNNLIYLIEFLPLSLVENIRINAFQTILIYIIVIALIALLVTKRFKYTIIGFISCSLLIGMNLYQINKLNQQLKLSFHTAYTGGKIEFIKGETVFNFQTKVATNFSNPPSQQFDNLSLVIWEGRTFVFIEKPFRDAPPIKGSLEVDYVLIRNNSISQLDKLMDYFKFKQLILDHTNRKHLTNILIKQAEKLNLDYRSIKPGGNLILDF